MFPEAMNSIERRLFALLLCAATLMFSFGLGATDLWAPDEPRFAAVAEEVRQLEHGAESLVVLRLAGEPYTQKPPFYYWLVAGLASFEGHVSEISARLPSALAGLVCIWLTVHFGAAVARRPTVGLWSGAILLTVFRFAHLARRAQLDVILTAFVLLALHALFRLRDCRGLRGRDFYLLHGALALGVLTKGPVALLPIPAFAIYLAWQGRLSGFSRVFPLWSFGLSLGPVLAWIGLAVALTPPGFFEAAVVDNVFARFASGTAHVRPFYYFFYQFPLEFLPWTLLWPAAALFAMKSVKQRDDDALRDATRLLTTFVVLCFVFFSLSAGKRGLYLLPTYPAVALLCGMALDDLSRRSTPMPRAVWYGAAAAGALAIVFGAWVWLGDGFALAPWPAFRLPAAFGAGLAAAVGACVVAGWLAAHRGWPTAGRLVPVVAGLFALEWLVFSLAYPAFDSEKSPAPIARAAASLSQKNAPIGVFDHTAMKGGIAFYSGHRVVDLRSEESVRAFFASGGENIIVKASKLDRVPAVTDFEVRAAFRRGSRRVLVIGPTPATANPSRRTIWVEESKPGRARDRVRTHR
ncbi:MAG: glycosyltransferase family 39 protein [Myxococcota bacterium]|jgi:4-amino-4-deoxy-L-arabinose transferase-like glycosyltransferase|nr:glycosyltransferase family 39 protein [Myxococcota bacterium]